MLETDGIDAAAPMFGVDVAHGKNTFEEVAVGAEENKDGQA